MAKKKENYAAMSLEELRAKLLETEEEYQKRRFSKITGELMQTHLIKESRKDVARIKTFIMQKSEV